MPKSSEQSSFHKSLADSDLASLTEMEHKYKRDIYVIYFRVLLCLAILGSLLQLSEKFHPQDEELGSFNIIAPDEINAQQLQNKYENFDYFKLDFADFQNTNGDLLSTDKSNSFLFIPSIPIILPKSDGDELISTPIANLRDTKIDARHFNTLKLAKGEINITFYEYESKLLLLALISLSAVPMIIILLSWDKYEQKSAQLTLIRNQIKKINRNID